MSLPTTANRSIRETTELILEVEDRFPVDEIFYRGIRVWPLLRLCLLQSLNGQEKVGAPSFRSRLRERRKEPFPKAWKTDQQILKSDAQLDSAASVIYFEWRTFIVSGSSKNQIHRFFDLIREEIGSQSKRDTICWENLPEVTPTAISRGYTINELLSGVYAQLDREIVPTHRCSKLLRRIIKFWNQSGDRSPVAVSGFLRDCEVVYRLSEALHEILPGAAKVVFLTCFYNVTSFAMALACKSRGIDCVEVQHGQQGDWHPMYTHWSRMPKEGYNLIPNYFWMWNEAGRRRIEDWGSEFGVRALIGGNPWLIRQIEIGVDYKRKSDPRKKTYLVSLQNFALPDFFWETVKSLPDGFWIFRVHPRHPGIGDETLEKCKSVLAEASYEFQDCKAGDIYEVFSRVDVQITGWSTSAYEALSFDVPTVLIHKNGWDAMREDINKGLFYYADTEEDLGSILAQRFGTGKLKSPLESDRWAVRSALREILRHSILKGAPAQLI